MKTIPNDIEGLFADRLDQLQHAVRTDPGMARLTEQYRDINATLHLVETNREPMCDVEALRLRRLRVALMKQIEIRLGASRALEVA